jgi:hypothetical protein
VVLATQNPVDPDYKGLSNTGTWFLGRLQTERDKARVLDGLEGASVAAGGKFDRGQMETVLSGLASRVFLMNNVHESHPVVFQSRWALSYLRGPLTRQQIAGLMADRKASATADPGTPASSAQPTATPLAAGTEFHPPVLPPGVEVFYLQETSRVSKTSTLIYRPALLAHAKVHFVKATYKVDTWEACTILATVEEPLPKSIWEEAAMIKGKPLDLEQEPTDNAAFAALPSELANAKNYASWKDNLKKHLYQSQELTLYKCPDLKEYSQPNESEGDFRVRLRHLAREHRDLEVEKLRKKYGTKFEAIQKRIKTAQAGVAREESQASRAYLDSAMSFGSTILGALFGRKTASRTNVSKASTSLRSAGRAAQQKGDVARAEEKVEDLKEELEKLEQELAQEIKSLELQFDEDNLKLEPLEVTPRKSDIEAGNIALVWTPWRIDANGIAEPLYVMPT